MFVVSELKILFFKSHKVQIVRHSGLTSQRKQPKTTDINRNQPTKTNETNRNQRNQPKPTKKSLWTHHPPKTNENYRKQPKTTENYRHQPKPTETNGTNQNQRNKPK